MLVWARILEALDSRGGAAMVTIASTQGSSPREAGARMIVNADGTFTGTVGGGTLEWRAIALAQSALGTDRAVERRPFVLGPELGQCCGGQVELVVETFGDSDLQTVAHFADLEEKGRFATRGSLGERSNLDRTVVKDPIGAGDALFVGDELVEGFGEQQRRLLLFGAGHVGKALVLAMAPLPFTVEWFDPRADAFPTHVPANVTTRQLGDPEGALADAPAQSFALIMSHSHQLDLALVYATLADSRFVYVGLIGSKTKRARFEKRLAAAGIPRDRIDTLVCPIGIGGITSKQPAAIAAATAAQLLASDEAIRTGAKHELTGSEKTISRLSSRS